MRIPCIIPRRAACFAVAAVLLAQCQGPGRAAHRVTPLYRLIESKRVGYCYPIVNESVVLYDNSFTDQHYHAVDPKRTADAFVRDFNYCLARRNLRWTPLPDTLQGWLMRPSETGLVDSIPGAAREALTRAHIDYVVALYNIRLSHVQSVGAGGEEPLSGGQGGTGIRRTLSYTCSILDAATGDLLFLKEMKLERAGPDLNIVEKALSALLDQITGKN